MTQSNVDNILTGKEIETNVEPATPAPHNEEPKNDAIQSQDNDDYGVAPDAGEPAQGASQDEYGNDVIKEKVYTEEEVNRMMRERFNRSQVKKEIEQPQQQNINSDEDAERLLESMVEKAYEKVQHKSKQKQQEEYDKKLQAEFEGKLLTGMGKYKDFQEVVQSAPITDPMVLATRNMKDPAAFLYAASKTQKKELERISQIIDPLTQALEIGRLEEKMRKIRNASRSPDPMSHTKGESGTGFIKASIDDRVQQYGMKKFQRR